MRDQKSSNREAELTAPTAVGSGELLGFGDALRIARGCHDYSGGHHTDGHYDAYHHGIQTVINVLEAAEKAGLNDTQVAAVWCIGGEKPNEKS